MGSLLNISALPAYPEHVEYQLWKIDRDGSPDNATYNDTGCAAGTVIRTHHAWQNQMVAANDWQLFFIGLHDRQLAALFSVSSNQRMDNLWTLDEVSVGVSRP
jgi:hypothetical protein